MAFEKHLRSVSRAASQWLRILKDSSIPWQIASWETLSGFILPFLEYCSAVWCSAADIYAPYTTGQFSSGARFLTGGVFECDIAHRRSVAVLVVQDQVYRDAPSLWWSTLTVCAIAGYARSFGPTYVYIYVLNRCRTSQYHRTFRHLSVSLLNDLAWWPCLRLCGNMGSLFVSYCIPFHFFLVLFSSFYGLVLWVWGLRTDRVLIALFLPCIFQHFKIIIIT